jgi:hypothetical protein
LLADDPRLLQGATVDPPPLTYVRDWPVEAACALGFCGWQGGGLETVAEVEDYFARACVAADQQLGEPGASRSFIDWYDAMPRAEMRRHLAEEVDRTLAARLADVLQDPGAPKRAAAA